jgi:cytochrome P450
MVAGMEDELARLVDHRVYSCRDKTRVDVVSDVASPVPVTVISRLLGVPTEDESHFHEWAEKFVDNTAQAGPGEEERARRRFEALADLGGFLAKLVERRRRDPGPDMLSRLVTDSGEGQPLDEHLVQNAVLLLIAGHETTVNLISNGMLTLLRHPHMIERLRTQPEFAVPLIEELLRYEPPVQFLPTRTTLTDVIVSGTTIPKGQPVTLLLAAGSRDPARFRDPDRFDPDRPDNEHLGFGSGIHYCFGAPLARLEVQLALTAMARRFDNPRLVADPPPYRPSAVLRGPRELLVDVDGVRD